MPEQNSFTGRTRRRQTRRSVVLIDRLARSMISIGGVGTILAVLGVFVLRRRFPELRGRYRTWGYPVTPLIYLGVTAWMLYFVVRERPVESLAGVATLAVGAGVFFLGNPARRVRHSALSAASLVTCRAGRDVLPRRPVDSVGAEAGHPAVAVAEHPGLMDFGDPSSRLSRDDFE